MAVNNGFSRNIELRIMIDKYNKVYREHALVNARNLQWLISSLNSNEVPSGMKQLIWLRVMGLIETRDMV